MKPHGFTLETGDKRERETATETDTERQRSIKRIATLTHKKADFQIIMRGSPRIQRTLKERQPFGRQEGDSYRLLGLFAYWPVSLATQSFLQHFPINQSMPFQPIQ